MSIPEIRSGSSLAFKITLIYLKTDGLNLKNRVWKMIVGVISISLQVFACFEGAFFCWVAMMIETCKQNTY